MANGMSDARTPSMALAMSTANSGAPVFSADGFIKPAAVPLVVDGKMVNRLVSPRSAAEYGVEKNGAGAHEFPSALAMAPGQLAPEDALKALGTGVWVSNLWYLNVSDRNAARYTGMTRFATFWVEDGELVAPLDVMRFDASVYDLFGEGLEAIGSDAAFLPDAFRKNDGMPDTEFEGYQYFTFPMDHHEFVENGIIGNPMRATAEKGEALLDASADEVAETVRQIRALKPFG